MLNNVKGKFMNLFKNILSVVCSLLAGFITFFICIYGCRMLDVLTHHRFSGFWRIAAVVSGLILGIIVSGFVKNLIYEEPTRF